MLGVREELEIGFVPCSPLGAGFLTGKIDTTTNVADNELSQHLATLCRRCARGNARLEENLAAMI